MSDWPLGYLRQPAADHLPRRWVVSFGIAAAVGSIYFLATSLAFGLLFKTDTIAVFWPASGISAGALIALGWRARWPVATGVMVAVVAIHLIASDTASPLLIGIVSGIADVVETLVIASLVERWCGTPFALDRLANVAGMLAAAVIGISISGIGGIAASRLKTELPATEAILTIWQHWVAANVIGFVTVAPLLIGVAAALRSPPSRNELFEGAAGLAVLAGMTAIIISLSQKEWETLVPLAWLFPVLSWLAGRCRPVIVAGSVFIVSITIIWTTTAGIGHFGDPDLSFDDRILGAQVGVLVVAVGAYVLAALFAERRDSEARLIRSNMMLERERDNKLTTVQAALASVAHEVKQPLTGIAANVGAALRFLQMTPPRYDRVQAALSQMSDACRHASDVLDGVRALFKKGDQEQQLIDVNEIVLDVLRSMDGQLKDHEVATRIELASELPPLHGHKGQLQEVLSNLLLNAVEAMGATVDRPRVLRVKTELGEDRTISVAIEDSGPGISDKNLANIFNAFVTTKRDGTGLGLAISQSIVERHGGRIAVSSDGKSGALFQLVLPAAAMSMEVTEARLIEPRSSAF
jgi:signal transduction histidine kinase